VIYELHVGICGGYLGTIEQLHDWWSWG